MSNKIVDKKVTTINATMAKHNDEFEKELNAMTTGDEEAWTEEDDIMEDDEEDDDSSTDESEDY